MQNTNRVFSATTEKEAISSHGERLSEFIWLTCMNNFCRGSKYTETKINLKRLHRCWREGDNSGKNEKWKLAAKQTCRSRAEAVFYKLENNLKWTKKFQPGK